MNRKATALILLVLLVLMLAGCALPDPNETAKLGLYEVDFSYSFFSFCGNNNRGYSFKAKNSQNRWATGTCCCAAFECTYKVD